MSAERHWPVGADVKTRLGQGGTETNLGTVNGAVRVDPEKAELEKPQ